MLPLLLALSLATSQDPADTYLDARSRDLVLGARARLETVDRSITQYQATAKERISLGLRTKLRERLFYRRETASRIDWKRGGPINITVLGAREVVPVASAKAQIPGDLKNFLPRLAFDPMDQNSLMRVDTTSLRHPLTPGAEAHYQFRTGDSTTINLGDRTIKLVELLVIPRRREVRLISGSFWIEATTYSPVQVVFRLAKDFDFMVDGVDEDEKDDIKKIPGFLKPIRAELGHVSIEYGLIHLRWWMPRLFAMEGMMQMGAIRTPLNYERSYSDYQVVGDTLRSLVRLADLPDSERPMKPCVPPTQFSVNVGTENDRPTEEQLARRKARAAKADSIYRAELAKDTARARRAKEGEECAKLYTVTVADSSKLMNSVELPPSIYGDKEELTSDPELKQLADRLRKLAEPPWSAQAATFAWGLGGNGLLRYNKVEALSIGARTELDLARLKLDALARIGVADRDPKFELGLTRGTPDSWLRAVGYRRLDAMDRLSGMGGTSASLGALLLGYDERDYYHTMGGELLLRPGEVESQWFDVRLFGETQRAVSKQTDFSLRSALQSSHDFDPNLQAQRADQFGGALTLRKSSGQNPARPRLAGELTAEVSNGTFGFTRESALLQLTTPLPFKLTGGIEAAAGTSTGTVPTQSQWFLGGTRSLRGYSIGEAAGNAFWRGRAEVALGLPLARVALFSDFGWAGPRHDVETRANMLSVGVGGSLIDGLLRVDLARALRGRKGWMLSMSVDGIL